MSEKILDRINSPEDLKSLSVPELESLAQEVRDLIISTVSKTGGHLAPNLGVVELTIALHYALESPKDKIIWDVGHQSYIHKILTGRRDRFSTLRQEGGISGFPKRAESEHDAVDTGHSSTSLSFAVGLAEARRKTGEEGKVVAVIGDGALTAGMAYEALNQGGHLKSPVMVILNDNEMSISESVGAFSAYLGRVRLDSHYRRWEKAFEDRIKDLPAIGDFVYEVGKRIKGSIKELIVPGMLFEELGFKYIGPLDGHNIELVAENVKRAKEIDGPVLIHVITKKGRGYGPAEENPDRFHGTGAFDVRTGQVIKSSDVPSYTEVFGDAMVELAREDERIVALTAAMTLGTGLDKFAAAYPDRFYDVGIAEQHGVAFAAALAMGGLKPVAAIYSTFLQRAYDQIVHDVALQNLPVVFAIDRAGIVGEDGPTHHGCFDLSYLLSTPNMTVMAPKDENELRHMLMTAVRMESPVAVRYPRRSGLGVSIAEQMRPLEVGKAEVLRRGSDVLMVALGTMVKAAEDAADILEAQGIFSTVVNARFAKPLDHELITSLAQEHHLVVTLEENAIAGGFGENVLTAVTSRGVLTPTIVMGISDQFVEHGSIGSLLAKLGLDGESVAAEVSKKLLGVEAPGKLFKSLRKTFLGRISSLNGAKEKNRRIVS